MVLGVWRENTERRETCDLATAGRTQGWLWRHRVKMQLLLLVGVATSRCLHDETQKTVRLLRPHFSQTPIHFRSSILPLPDSHGPQPLRIHIYYTRDPISNEAWAPDSEEMRGASRALAALRETTRRIQSILAGKGGARNDHGRLRGGEVQDKESITEKELNSDDEMKMSSCLKSSQYKDLCF